VKLAWTTKVVCALAFGAISSQKLGPVDLVSDIHMALDHVLPVRVCVELLNQTFSNSIMGFSLTVAKPF